LPRPPPPPHHERPPAHADPDAFARVRGAAALGARAAARADAGAAPARGAALLAGLETWFAVASGELGEVGKVRYSPDVLAEIGRRVLAERAAGPPPATPPLSSSAAAAAAGPGGAAPGPAPVAARDDAHVRAFDARQRRQARFAAWARSAALTHPDGPRALCGVLAWAHPAFRSRVRRRARAPPARLPRREFCPRLYRPAGDAAAADAAAAVAARAGVPLSTILAFSAGAARARPRPLAHHADVFATPSPRPLLNAALLARAPPSHEIDYLRLAARGGFDIMYSGGLRAVFADNDNSAYADAAFVDGEVAAWLAKGWAIDVTELYVASPGLPFIAARLGVVTNHAGKKRLICNMSAPLGNCVNDYADSSRLPPAVCATPASVADAIDAARACGEPGEPVHLIVSDVRAAYKQLPVPVAQWWANGFLWRGRALVSTVLQFGLRPAAQILARAAAPILADVTAGLGLPRAAVDLFVDDAILAAPASLAAPSPARPGGACGALAASFADGGLPVAVEKSQNDGITAVYTGWRFGTVAMSMSIPAERLAALRAELLAAARARRVRLSELVTLLGRLQWAAGGLRVLGATLGPLFDAVAACRDARHWVALGGAARDVLNTWAAGLAEYKGVSLLRHPAPRHEVFSDASGSWGWGWVCPALKLFGYGAWPPALEPETNNVKEALALLAAACGMDEHAPGTPCLFRSDNTTAVALMDNNKGRHDRLARLGCRFALRGQRALHTPKPRVKHIPGQDNALADALSRGSLPAEVAAYTRCVTTDATLVAWTFDPVRV